MLSLKNIRKSIVYELLFKITLRTVSYTHLTLPTSDVV